MKVDFLRYAVLSVIALGWVSHAVAAPVTFNTALPVGKSEFIFREQFVLNQSGNDPSGADRDRRELTSVSVLGYGIIPDLSVFGLVPYTDRNLEGTTVTRSASGLGDVRLFGRYTIYRRDSVSTTFRIAPFGGVKAPTGDDNETDSMGTLPASVQTGSGSWDIFGGIVASHASSDWQVDSQISYQKNN